MVSANKSSPYSGTGTRSGGRAAPFALWRARFNSCANQARPFLPWQFRNAVRFHQAKGGDGGVVVAGAEQGQDDGKQGLGAGRVLADGVAVVDEVLDSRRDAQAAQVEMAVERRRNPGCWGGVGFGEVVEIGGVVTEIGGLTRGYFPRLVGLEVVGAGDAKDTGEVGRAVHVPTLVAADPLEELLPTAAQAAECLPVVAAVEPGEFLEQPVGLESVAGVDDEGRLVGYRVEQRPGRVFARWQGVARLVGRQGFGSRGRATGQGCR